MVQAFLNPNPPSRLSLPISLDALSDCDRSPYRQSFKHYTSAANVEAARCVSWQVKLRFTSLPPCGNGNFRDLFRLPSPEKRLLYLGREDLQTGEWRTDIHSIQYTVSHGCYADMVWIHFARSDAPSSPNNLQAEKTPT